MRYYERAARCRRGQLVGGAEGLALVQACKQAWTDDGVRAPEKLLRMLAP
jgi:hypothetical protein